MRLAINFFFYTQQCLYLCEKTAVGAQQKILGSCPKFLIFLGKDVCIAFQLLTKVQANVL